MLKTVAMRFSDFLIPIWICVVVVSCGSSPTPETAIQAPANGASPTIEQEPSLADSFEPGSKIIAAVCACQTIECANQEMVPIEKLPQVTPTFLAKLTHCVTKFTGAPVEEDYGTIDPETRRQLEALGYFE